MIRNNIGKLAAILASGVAFVAAEDANASRVCPTSGPDSTVRATYLSGSAVCATSIATVAKGKLLGSSPGGAQGRRIEAYIFNSDPGHLCAKSRGRKTIAGLTSDSCIVKDTLKDGQWEYDESATNPACDYTDEVWVTAYSNANCT